MNEAMRERMVDQLASGPLEYRPEVDDALMADGWLEWYDDLNATTPTEGAAERFYNENGSIRLEWFL